MRYFHTAAFKRAYQALDPARRHRVDRALRQLAMLYEQRQRSFGIGLKSLKPGIWEVRAGLDDRILFRWSGDLVELLLVGNHDEIRRMLRQL
jgi:hypothetical protein